MADDAANQSFFVDHTRQAKRFCDSGIRAPHADFGSLICRGGLVTGSAGTTPSWKSESSAGHFNVDITATIDNQSMSDLRRNESLPPVNHSRLKRARVIFEHPCVS